MTKPTLKDIVFEIIGDHTPHEKKGHEIIEENWLLRDLSLDETNILDIANHLEEVFHDKGYVAYPKDVGKWGTAGEIFADVNSQISADSKLRLHNDH